MLRTIFLGVGIACLLTLSAARAPVYAVALTNTDITDGTGVGFDGFSDFAGAAVVPLIENSFNFGAPGPDGKVRSRVYTGIGSASGLFVYAYQIIHDAASSEFDISGMSLDFTTDPSGIDVDPGAGTLSSFFIGTAPLTPPPAGFDAGSDNPDGASWLGGGLTFGFFAGGSGLLKGTTSYVFGTFSPLAPHKVIANLTNSGTEVLQPEVYAPIPVPEPATLFLLGSGLAGFGLRRRKVRKEEKS